MVRHIKAITFDLDDTLWDVRPVLISAEQTLYQWLRQKAPLLGQRFSEQALAEFKWQAMPQYPQLKHQISQLRIQVLTDALRASGYPVERAKTLAHQAFEVFIQARHDVTLFADAQAMLQQLQAHYTLGVLTNGNADFRRVGLGKYFDFGYSAEQLNASKPAAEPFIAALDLVGAQPQQMLHIGDHPVHDIEGAHRQGWHTIWVNLNNKPWPLDFAPSATASSMQEIVAAVAAVESSIG